MSLLASRIRRRWTAAQNAAATLPPGTLVYITDTPGVAVHNGTTPGGLLVSGGGGGAVAWADITCKPSTFTPATHTHAEADVTGLTAVLAAKAATTHTHAAADITSGVLNIARLATGTPDGTKFVRDDGTLQAAAGSGPTAPAAHLVFNAGSNLRSDTTGKLGVFFTASQLCGLTKIGRWKVSGNSQSHVLRLFTDSNKAEVASATVNMSGGAANTLIWANLASPIFILPGTVYLLTSDETNGGDQWLNSSGTSYASLSGLGSFGSCYYTGTWGKGTVDGTGYVGLGLG